MLKTQSIWTTRFLQLDRLQEEAARAAELYGAAQQVTFSFDEVADTTLEIATDLDRSR